MKKDMLVKIGTTVGLVLSIALHTASAAQVMRVDGKQLLDSNGVPFLARGIECQFWPEHAANQEALVNAFAAQGFNAVRAQLWELYMDDLPAIEAFIQRCHAKGMVVYLTDDNNPDQDNWFNQPEVQAMIERNKYNLVIDATIEEGGDPEQDPGVVAAWLAEQKQVISMYRAWGYTQPLTIGTPKAGRYLRALLDHGQELVNHDPLHSLVLNAQMYWGEYNSPSGWSYQRLNGFSDGDEGIREAAAAVASKPFLIQWGLDAIDGGGEDVPYELLMSEAQEHGIGTMWWQWRGNSTDLNSLAENQFQVNSLTPLGDIVINLHPASIKETSELVSKPYP